MCRNRRSDNRIDVTIVFRILKNINALGDVGFIPNSTKRASRRASTALCAGIIIDFRNAVFTGMNRIDLAGCFTRTATIGDCTELAGLCTESAVYTDILINMGVIAVIERNGILRAGFRTAMG